MEELGKRRDNYCPCRIVTKIVSSRFFHCSPLLVDPALAALLIGVADKLIDIYGDVVGQSEMIIEFEKLKKQVKDESRAQKAAISGSRQPDAI
jgi:hypothetical protein